MKVKINNNKEPKMYGSIVSQISQPLSVVSELFFLQNKQNKIPSYKKIQSNKDIKQEQTERVKKILLSIKAKMLRDLFIKKLRRNVRSTFRPELQLEEKLPSKYSCRIKGIEIPESIEYVIIALNILSLIILLFITSLSATIEEFSQETAFSAPVKALNAFNMVASVLHFLMCIFGVNFRKGQHLIYIDEIAKSYFKSGESIIDLIIIIMLILIMVIPNNQTINAVFFSFLVCIFLKTVSELIHLEAAYIHSRRISLLWRLSKVIIFNVIIAHIVCTVLLAMALIDPENSWLTKYSIHDDSWTTKLIVAYYWGMILATTVGFGDISPNTTTEQLIVAFLALFGCLILGFNLSEFANIFSSYRKAENYKNMKKITFKRMLARDKNNNAEIDPSLKKQIYKFIEDSGGDEEDAELGVMQKNTFIATLPEHLRKSYLKASNKRIFESVLFLNQLKDETLTLLGETFNNNYVAPDEELLDPGTYISILEEGKVGFSYQKIGSTLNGKIMDFVEVKKKEGLALLTSDFISLYKRYTNYGLVSEKYSIVWTISIENFTEILRNDVLDYEYYFTTLHKHPLDFDEWETMLCPRCTTNLYKSYHSIFNCPQLTYMPSRKMIIYKDMKSVGGIQERTTYFIRKKNHQFKTSILKYFRSYYEVLELSRMMLEEEQNYVMNFFTKRNFNNYYSLKELFTNKNKERQRAVNDHKGKNSGYLEVDSPENFEHYFPRYNACNLIFKSVDSFHEQVNYERTERNIVSRRRV